MAGRHARPSRAAARAGLYARQPQPVSPSVLALRRRRLRRAAGNSAGGAAALSGVVIVGVLGGSGTLALWHDEVTLGPGEITISEPSLVVDTTPALPSDGDPASHSVTASNLLPGERAVQAISIANDGTVALDVTAHLAVSPSTAFEVSILPVADIASCTPAAMASAPQVSADEEHPTPLVDELDAEDVAYACVGITATDDLLPLDGDAGPADEYESSGFTVVIGGTIAAP